MEPYDFLLIEAKKRNFCDIGVCDAEDFEFLRPIFEKTASLLEGFVEKDIEKRIYPNITMPEAKSIIVVARRYGKKINVVDDGVLRGYISLGAVEEDYHIHMMKDLDFLSAKLSENYGGKYKAFVDTGPLCERELALRSGIGYKGKNHMIVTKNGGAEVFLGYIFTDLELPVAKYYKDMCDTNCNRCLKACPTGAISEIDFSFEKCISFITQKKGMLTTDEMKAIGKNIYGCDVCQKVCSKNIPSEEIIEKIDDIKPKLEELLGLSNKDFSKKFKKTAIGWRGNKVIKRNALCVLGNIGEQGLELLSEYVVAQDDILRHTAIRSVININLPEGSILLKNLLEKEKNEKIRREILWAIGHQED